jgi:hypothetical protein
MDTDNLITEQLKKIDFKKVYKKTPTQVEKKDDDVDKSVSKMITEVSVY